MSFYSVRREGESSEKLVNRFKKLTQRSVREAKNSVFRKKALKKRLVRTKALKREEFRAEKAKNQFYS